MNSANARQRADDLKVRLRNRLTELDAERQLSSAPPVVVGGALVIPMGLLSRLCGRPGALPGTTTRLAAIQTVMAAERSLGRIPVVVPPEGQGYDIESRAPDGTPLFITVKHGLPGADSFSVAQSEIGVARNTERRHVLALVEGSAVRYVRFPFDAVTDPPFGLSGISLPWRSYFEHGQVPG
jgi:hypothetical protein